MRTWTIKSIRDNLRELKDTKTRHPETLEMVKNFWRNELQKRLQNV